MCIHTNFGLLMAVLQACASRQCYRHTHAHTCTGRVAQNSLPMGCVYAHAHAPAELRNSAAGLCARTCTCTCTGRVGQLCRWAVCTHMHMYALTHARMQTHTHTPTQPCTHSHTHIHVHEAAHTHSHSNTDTCTHTRIVTFCHHHVLMSHY